jgi:hypothetical protein
MKKLIFVMIFVLLLTGCAKKPIEDLPEVPQDTAESITDTDKEENNNDTDGDEQVTTPTDTQVTTPTDTQVTNIDGINYIFVDGYYMGYEHDGEILRHKDYQTTLFCDLLGVNCLYNDSGEKITELYINVSDYNTSFEDVRYGDILKKYASGEEDGYYKFTLPTKLGDDAKELRMYSKTTDFKFGGTPSRIVSSLPFSVSEPVEATLTDEEKAAATAADSYLSKLSFQKAYSADYDGDTKEEKLALFESPYGTSHFVRLKDGVATLCGDEPSDFTLDVVDFGNDGSKELVFSVAEPQVTTVSIYFDLVEVFSEFLPSSTALYMTETEFLSRLCEKVFGVYDHSWMYIHSYGYEMHLSGVIKLNEIASDIHVFKETFLFTRNGFTPYTGPIDEKALKEDALKLIEDASKELTPENVLVDLSEATSVEIGDRRITDLEEIKKLNKYFYDMKVKSIEYGVQPKDGEKFILYSHHNIIGNPEEKYFEMVIDADGFYYNGCRYNVKKGYLAPLVK